jgi:hypothetical protein|tara:strand:- start:451 stop:582 length:132 start_codon:yes stop_codon:yes gene_type:complete
MAGAKYGMLYRFLTVDFEHGTDSNEHGLKPDNFYRHTFIGTLL